MGPYGALHAFVKIRVLNWGWINGGESRVTLRAKFQRFGHTSGNKMSPRTVVPLLSPTCPQCVATNPGKDLS